MSSSGTEAKRGKEGNAEKYGKKGNAGHAARTYPLHRLHHANITATDIRRSTRGEGVTTKPHAILGWSLT
jgi:hypothetical protein